VVEIICTSSEKSSAGAVIFTLPLKFSLRRARLLLINFVSFMIAVSGNFFASINEEKSSRWFFFKYFSANSTDSIVCELSDFK